MYCKAMKRWLSGMLLFALVLAFGAPASANLLYTAQTYYSNTKLGKIDVDTATLLTPNSIGGNWGQGIFPFRDAQNRNRVAVTLYQGGADTIKILDPLSFSWSTPVATVSNDAQSNIRKMVSLGQYLYGISYGNNPYGGQPSDIANVRRFDMTGDNYVFDNNTGFAYTPAVGQGHGEGLVAFNNHLYAILSTTMGGYPFTYAPNKLVKLNADLNVVTSIDLGGKNTDGGTPSAYFLSPTDEMSVSSADLYITSWGGYQPTDTSYNPESQIERVNLNNLNHRTLVTGEWMRRRDPTWNHHFTAVAIHGRSAYIQATTWNRLPGTGGIGGQVRIYKRDPVLIENLLPWHKIQSLNTDGGWRVGMVVDGNYLYVAAGRNLYCYRLPVMSYSVPTVFGPNGTISLGGDISAFAFVPYLRDRVSAAEAALKELKQAKADAGDEKDSGGGCDAGFGWLLLLTVVPIALRRRG